MGKTEAVQATEQGGPKPRLTDKERHDRFVDMAREVEVDESPESFDRAFEAIVNQRKG